MKKILLIGLAVVAALSCSKVTDERVKGPAGSFEYAFTVAEKPSFDPDTRAVKTAWEDGDKIYIVFDDVVPQALTDFMILKFNGSKGDWDVIQESTATPNAAGGTLDALYYENPNPDGYFQDNGNATMFFMDSDRNLDGQYFYLNAQDVPYTVEDGKVLSSISLDFEPNNVRTAVQFRVSGLEGDWEFMLWTFDGEQSDVSFGAHAPVWQLWNKCFNYYGQERYSWKMNSREDGHYLYLSVLDKAEAITIGLHKSSGDHAGIYYKTFRKQISGKTAAITFTGPQFNASGVPTNGWTDLGASIAPGTLDGHGYVDLGGDVLWATANIGADTFDQSGDFFAWGEVEPHYSSLSPLVWKTGMEAGYDYADYKYWEITGENEGRRTKYDSDTEKEILESSDDAAAVNWGGRWRMPTKTEWDWILSNCTVQQLEGAGFFKITSKVSGYENRFILLPLAGLWAGQVVATYRMYWTSTSYPGIPSSYAVNLPRSSNIQSVMVPRPWGLMVRAVAPKE